MVIRLFNAMPRLDVYLDYSSGVDVTHAMGDGNGWLVVGGSLTATDRPTGDGSFLYGQITWDNGPLPGQTVRHCQ